MNSTLTKSQIFKEVSADFPGLYELKRRQPSSGSLPEVKSRVKLVLLSLGQIKYEAGLWCRVSVVVQTSDPHSIYKGTGGYSEIDISEGSLVWVEIDGLPLHLKRYVEELVVWVLSRFKDLTEGQGVEAWNALTD